MGEISPMDIIAILIIYHEQPGPQFFERADGKFGEQTVAAGIHKASVAVVEAPAFPEFDQLRSLAIRLRIPKINHFELRQFLLLLFEFLARPDTRIDISAQQECLVTI